MLHTLLETIISHFGYEEAFEGFIVFIVHEQMFLLYQS